MFIQIHMLQSMPPGNLNRDETGQPKKCIFGGVTRGRISSQCLKRVIRRSEQFKEAFGDALADRTTYLPQMVADAMRKIESGIPEEELEPLMEAIASRFKKSKDKQESDESEAGSNPDADDIQASDGRTGQLVFFPSKFAADVAGLVAELRKRNPDAYKCFIGMIKNSGKKEKKAFEAGVKELEQKIEEASRLCVTVDIALFGRMTTSNLVVNVEAACQVAHAISTHETIIESDYFTAMDDRKADFATSQMDKAGAAFMGSGETETFYNASVYYKYLNLDLDALGKHLCPKGEAWPDSDAAKAVQAFIEAAILANPTGKQNSFASHGLPELILVELSNAKRPVSYANAFLQPVDGPNYLTRSAEALKFYVEEIASAFAPAGVKRYLLAVGHARTTIGDAASVKTLEALVDLVGKASVSQPVKAKS